MENEYFDKHPNWVALASINIPYKRFVKPSNSINQDNLEVESKFEISTNLTGYEVKEFYETLTIKSDNSKSSSSVSLIRKVDDSYASSKNAKSKDIIEIDFDENKFFHAATHNDLKILKSFKYENDIINSTDQYGWSALMMASCENSFEAVEFLLSKGANIDIKDKRGNNALNLSKEKQFFNIVNLLKNHKNKNYNDHTSRERKHKEKIKTFKHFCNICDKEFNITNIKEHQTSTIHLFNVKNENKRSFRYTTISNKNRGLKLMIKQGWDRESGLGPAGSGNLYPIKTIIRKTRTGLGIEQDSAKVTHFKPYDLDAIKYRAPPRAKSRNEMRKEQRKNQKIERRLRNELS